MAWYFCELLGLRCQIDNKMYMTVAMPEVGHCYICIPNGLEVLK